MKLKLIVIALVAVLAVLGVFAAGPMYRNWKETRAVRKAREFLRQGDFRNASLSARLALGVNPANLAACRVMAGISEKMRLPVALEWRKRIVDLEGDNFTNRLELASAALLLGEYQRAAEALSALDRTNRNTAAFHQLAAMVEVGLGNLGAAEQHFSEARRLDPENKRLQLNQAIIQLQSRDQQVAASALKALEQLYTDPACHMDALRHLAMAAIHVRNFPRALTFTKELLADRKAPLDDRLMHLSVLKDSASPDFAAYYSELQRACATDADSVVALTSWLLARGLADDAARWLATLSADLREKPQVKLARADCFIAQKNWRALRELLEGDKWNELEFLHQAMLARANRELGDDLAAQAEWRAALRATMENPKALSGLARLASRWGWERETEGVLWVILEHDPGEGWALQTLGQIYLKAGNTRGLHKVYSTLVSFDTNDSTAKNNLAAVSLLLNLQPAKAHELARQAFLRATNNAAFASTYAYSLYLQGRVAEGIAIMDSLKPAQLEIPGVALYYGALQASNAPAKAKKYLDLAEHAPLLPEEKALLVSARKAL